MMELAIVARRAVVALEGRGVLLERAYMGTFLSALEMAGVSLSILRVDDPRLARLDAPTEAPAWPRTPAPPIALASAVLVAVLADDLPASRGPHGRFRHPGASPYPARPGDGRGAARRHVS